MCKPVQNKQNNHILRFEICYTFNKCTFKKKKMIGCTLHESVTMSWDTANRTLQGWLQNKQNVIYVFSATQMNKTQRILWKLKNDMTSQRL